MSMEEMLRYFNITVRKCGKKIYIMNDSLFQECWNNLKNKPTLARVHNTHKINVKVYIINNKKYIEK